MRLTIECDFLKTNVMLRFSDCICFIKISEDFTAKRHEPRAEFRRFYNYTAL